MSNSYEEAKEIARKLLNAEKTRKTAQEEAKLLKEELLAMIEENNIATMFEFSDGVVMAESTTSYKIADGLKEETEVKSKSPEKLSQDFIEEYFVPDVKLSKNAKKAILNEDSKLLSVLIPENKVKIKVVFG